MNGWADVCPPRPVRLVARRRSRCWKCDRQMRRDSPQSWWCPKCAHLVTYTYSLPEER